jgi:DNA-binding XRE family transcriptional regulator
VVSRPLRIKLLNGIYTIMHPADRRTRAEAQLLGARIRELRSRAGMTVAEVSEATGIDQADLYRLETGQKPNPRLSTIVKVATALNRRTAALFNFEGLEA